MGDIHGHADALRRLLDEIQPQTSDTVVPLGDYVNRGLDSRGVIEALIKLSEHCRVFPILGNHDEMMLDARSDLYALDRFRHDGGEKTLDSYCSESWFYASDLSFVPDSHWEFLQRCLPSYETDACIFTHACYDPFVPMKAQPTRLLRWTSIEDVPPAPHVSGKLVVVGHTPKLFVRHYGHVVCIDTACGFGGRLTAHEPATGMTWWVDESGNTKQGGNP
ncbi:metallophosphoesterase family protein [Rhodopirellula europaea]|uniref:metallophosphoesterase family protein n=1 Tax=Rhodopirellula europaea TaxID=1263866 RepID=UPI003D2E785A